MTTYDHGALGRRIAAAAARASINDSAPALVQAALSAGDGALTAHGALAVTTGPYTGRSAADKFIVRDDVTDASVWWENSNAMSPAAFETLMGDFEAAMEGRELYVQNLAAGAAAAHRLRVRVMTTSAWHALFIRNLLIRPAAAGERADVTILHLPGFTADPARHGTRSGTVIALDMGRRIVLIGGTAYAGEIKKAVFSLFNFHAPFAGVLPMHCSANIGPGGDVALFFGLSGTGKTTLSSAPARRLIGDDEHGWSDEGVFNLEGGCYAKTIRLDPAAEPEIHAATRRFGTVLENVALDPETGLPDFADDSLTENTRAAYPLEALAAVHAGGVAGVPGTVILLTADAFGVLPPLARLTPRQTVEQFLLGYTAKVAGTERGVTEPVATFSACFGAPFMALHPKVYGRLLEERLKASGAATWLINTGWTGGPHGVGRRIDIDTTRRLVAAALSGELEGSAMRTDPVFGLTVPVRVEGVEPRLMDPRANWADPSAYDTRARELLALFKRNSERLRQGPETLPERAPQAAE